MAFPFVAAAVSLFLAQTPDAALDQLASQHIQKNKIPGTVLVVVRGDRVAYAKGFGVANVETGEAVTPDHLFRVGSTTKMMVAASVLKLTESTRLRLTDPVDLHVPNLDPAIGKLTAHQLLSHTSGLLDRAPMYGLQDDTALGANVRSWKADMLFTEPGKVYSYSNPGYALAGRLIESVSGRSFADALEDLIFKPAGMNRTTFRPTMAMTYPLAQGHDTPTSIARPAANNAGYWPAGSMFTSGRDFARFAIALLHDGEVDGKRVLSAKAVREMMTPKVKVDGSVDGKFYGYGLSLDPEFDLVEHAGGRMGYTSHVMLHPKDKLAVIVLTNLNGGDAGGLARAAMDLVFGQKAAPRKLPPSQSANLSAYVGSYRNDPESVITVTVGSPAGHLLVKMNGRSLDMAPSDAGNCFESRPPSVTTLCFSGAGNAYAHAGGRSFARY